MAIFDANVAFATGANRCRVQTRAKLLNSEKVNTIHEMRLRHFTGNADWLLSSTPVTASLSTSSSFDGRGRMGSTVTEDDEDTESNPIAGEAALDRLACALGGKTMLPQIISNISHMLQHVLTADDDSYTVQPVYNGIELAPEGCIPTVVKSKFLGT